MRWVTYLSPSGGAPRPGVVDDGCVLGYPGNESLPELLSQDRSVLASAYQRAVAAPMEIIVEFETRLCPPFMPQQPVRILCGDQRVRTVDPEFVHGTDDSVVVPSPEAALVAHVGAAAVFSGQGRCVGYSLACLWTLPDGRCAGLTFGPAVVTHEELDGSDITVSGSIDDVPLAVTVIDGKLDWAEGISRANGIVAATLDQTRPLTAGEELLVASDVLGEFEMRVCAEG
ncbi:hypothetical protein [Salinactinospora qingdaonensis]|uniref:Uncharacterized protein n=1 Tax=Salinactinospora qingdaonensis TaxID=702744 RepID=A0ABP7FE97_9ACTN